MSTAAASHHPLDRSDPSLDSDRIEIWIASVCIGAAAVSAAAWALGLPQLALGALIAVPALALWVTYAGTRPALVAACLCLTPPGLLGENYGKVGLLVIGLLWLAVATAPAERAPLLPLAPVLIGAEGVAFVIAAVSESAPAVSHVLVVVAALYAGTALAAYELSKRPALARDALRALSLVVAFTCVSYLIGVLDGFAGAREVVLPFRTVTFSPPFTLTGGNAANYLSTPRFLTLGGEPGLGSIFLLVALAAALTLESGRRRVVLVALLGTGAAATQSTGLVIALVAMGCAAAFALITRRVALIVATVLTLAALPIALAVANLLIDRKERLAPLSLTDRGFAGGVGNTSISLSTAWEHTPVLVVPLIAILAYFTIMSARKPVQLGLVAAIAVTAWYAQPLQYHPGVWLLLLALAVVPTGALAAEATEAVPVEPSEPRPSWPVLARGST